jgi:hypothetical protein
MNTDRLWEVCWRVPLCRSKKVWAVDESGPELCGVTDSLCRSFVSSWSTRDMQWFYYMTLRQPGVSAGLISAGSLVLQACSQRRNLNTP